jgi:hypothetical protein
MFVAEAAPGGIREIGAGGGSVSEASEESGTSAASEVGTQGNSLFAAGAANCAVQTRGTSPSDATLSAAIVHSRCDIDGLSCHLNLTPRGDRSLRREHFASASEMWTKWEELLEANLIMGRDANAEG